MPEASLPSNDLAPGLTHWWASSSHPVPPAAGSYVLVDGSPVLAATAPGPIVAVLVLSAESEEEQTWAGYRSGIGRRLGLRSQ